MSAAPEQDAAEAQIAAMVRPLTDAERLRLKEADVNSLKMRAEQRPLSAEEVALLEAAEDAAMELRLKAHAARYLMRRLRAPLDQLTLDACRLRSDACVVLFVTARVDDLVAFLWVDAYALALQVGGLGPVRPHDWEVHQDHCRAWWSDELAQGGWAPTEDTDRVHGFVHPVQYAVMQRDSPEARLMAAALAPRDAGDLMAREARES